MFDKNEKTNEILKQQLPFVEFVRHFCGMYVFAVTLEVCASW